MEIEDLLLGAGVLGTGILAFLLILFHYIISTIVGISFANIIGFTGVSWWAFVILFDLCVISFINRGNS